MTCYFFYQMMLLDSILSLIKASRNDHIRHITIISTEKMPVLVMFGIYLASPSYLPPHLFGIFVTSVCRLAPNNTFTEKSIIHSSDSDGLRVAGKSAVW